MKGLLVLAGLIPAVAGAECRYIIIDGEYVHVCEQEDKEERTGECRYIIVNGEYVHVCD